LGKNYKGKKMFEPIEMIPIMDYDSDVGSSYDYEESDDDEA
jgi:hypothetical protein